MSNASILKKQDIDRLINENFLTIKNKLIKAYKGNKDEANEAISYLPDVAREYKKSKDNIGFTSFAYVRCKLRLLDHKRRMNVSSDRSKAYLINKIRDDISKQYGFCSDCMIQKYIAKKKLKVKFSASYNPVLLKDLEYAFDCHAKTTYDSNFSEVVDCIIDLTKNDNVRRKILIEYTIPMSQKLPHKSIKKIAKELGKSETAIYEMINDDVTKDIVRKSIHASVRK